VSWECKPQGGNIHFFKGSLAVRKGDQEIRIGELPKRVVISSRRTRGGFEKESKRDTNAWEGRPRGPRQGLAGGTQDFGRVWGLITHGNETWSGKCGGRGKKKWVLSNFRHVIYPGGRCLGGNMGLDDKTTWHTRGWRSSAGGHGALWVSATSAFRPLTEIA